MPSLLISARLVVLRDLAARDEFVRETGAVRDQIFDGDRPLRRRNRTVGAEHRHLREALVELRQHVVQPQLALLDQDQRHHRGDRFRHRINAIQRVLRNRLLRGIGVTDLAARDSSPRRCTSHSMPANVLLSM